MSLLDPLRNSSSGLPLTASHRKVENAPGKTETNPNRDSAALSK